MPDIDYLTELLGFQGFCVKGLKIEKDKEVEKVIIDLGRTENRYICGGCGQVLATYYDKALREVRHLHLFKYLTVLRFYKVRVDCPRCGVKAERLGFVDKRLRTVTSELFHQVSELCKVMTIEHVGAFEHLHWQTVKDIDKRAIASAQAKRDLSRISTLGIDEIAVGRGHKYWHMISSLDGPNGPEMLYVGEGRKEADLEPFWKWFGVERTKNITHAVMDMWKGFIRSFREHCPQVKIIYDKFHVMRHLLQVLNEIRKAEFRRADRKMRGLLCGKKFILLKKASNLKGEARKALKRLLSVNRRIYKAYVLKESFERLWAYTYKGAAQRFWEGWKEQLKWQRLEPYKRFAKMIDTHIDGILAHCDKKVSLGYIEGANLKARNIIRRAYGYRDKEYMKLKIIQGCSSIGAFRPYPYITHYNPG